VYADGGLSDMGLTNCPLQLRCHCPAVSARVLLALHAYASEWTPLRVRSADRGVWLACMSTFAPRFLEHASSPQHAARTAGCPTP
jgi:hypothetical protein